MNAVDRAVRLFNRCCYDNMNPSTWERCQSLLEAMVIALDPDELEEFEVRCGYWSIA